MKTYREWVTDEAEVREGEDKRVCSRRLRQSGNFAWSTTQGDRACTKLEGYQAHREAGFSRRRFALQRPASIRAVRLPSSGRQASCCSSSGNWTQRTPKSQPRDPLGNSGASATARSVVRTHDAYREPADRALRGLPGPITGRSSIAPDLPIEGRKPRNVLRDFPGRRSSPATNALRCRPAHAINANAIMRARRGRASMRYTARAGTAVPA